MKGVIALSAAVLLVATAASAVTIAGLVYYLGDFDPETEEAPAYRVKGADVALFKRMPDDTWELVDTDTTSDVYADYRFDNVSTVGVNWFKVTVDAEDIENWPFNYYVLERVAYKQARPEGIPDAGIIRVDVIYAGAAQLLAEEPEGDWYFGFGGRYVHRDPETGEPVAPDMGAAMPHYPWHLGTCPIGENAYAFVGCRAGDWYSVGLDNISDEWPTAGWAHYGYYYPSDPPHAAGKFGDGYYWWDPALPWWAIHPSWTGPDYVQKVDVIEMPLP